METTDIEQRLNSLREAFKTLSLKDRRVFIDDVKALSNIQNPEREFIILKKKGEIISVSENEFRWMCD